MEVCMEDNQENAYAPAKDVKWYSLKYVIQSLDKSGNNNILNEPTEQLSKVLHIQENFLKAIENSPDNILIQDLPNYNKIIS